MNRRDFLSAAGAVSVAPVIAGASASEHAQAQVQPQATGSADRAYWVGVMTRLADPVLKNLAAGTLKAKMPVEQAAGRDRRAVSHLEAIGRLLAGHGAVDRARSGRLAAKAGCAGAMQISRVERLRVLSIRPRPTT